MADEPMKIAIFETRKRQVDLDQGGTASLLLM
jgi:hypothetical protein